MRTEYQLYIDGQWISQTDGCIRPDLEPATGYTLCQVHRAGPRDMERALASAQAAFADWSLTIADRRGAHFTPCRRHFWSSAKTNLWRSWCGNPAKPRPSPVVNSTAPLAFSV